MYPRILNQVKWPIYH